MNANILTLATLLWPLALLPTGNADGANLTEDNVEKTNAIIEAALEAYGGDQHLASLDSVVVEHKTDSIAVGQSRKPEPPWDRNSNSGVSAINFSEQIFAASSAGTGGGFEFNNSTIINGDQSYQLDYRASIATPVAQPNFDNSAGPFIRVTPALLVKQVNEHARTAHYLGQAKHRGKLHDVVGFSMAVGPAISLYFDQQTHMLTHSERVLPGFGLVSYEFLDYETVGGIPFNRKFELHLNGDLNMQRHNLKTTVNEPIESYAKVPTELDRVAAIEPDEMSRQEIAEGVYLIGGNGTYGLFIEMDDHVIAVGGTGGSPDRFSELRTALPDKPVTHAVLTHHHTDHLAAVPHYIEQGATVIAAGAHAKAVQDAAGENAELRFEAVNQRKLLTDGKRRVELIDIGPTAHTEHLLVTWLPKEKILFEADHFSMPRSGPVRPAVDSTRTFADALRRHEISPVVLTSAHSPRPGTMDDLQAALAKKPAKPKRAIANSGR